MWNLVLMCRRDHLLWHLGKITWQHLRIPWHPHARADAPPDTATDGFLDLVRAGP